MMMFILASLYKLRFQGLGSEAHLSRECGVKSLDRYANKIPEKEDWDWICLAAITRMNSWWLRYTNNPFFHDEPTKSRVEVILDLHFVPPETGSKQEPQRSRKAATEATFQKAEE